MIKDKWSDPEKRVMPFPSFWCSSYGKREPSGCLQWWLYIYIYIYIYGEMVDFGEADKMIKISGVMVIVVGNGYDDTSSNPG